MYFVGTIQFLVSVKSCFMFSFLYLALKKSYLIIDHLIFSDRRSSVWSHTNDLCFLIYKLWTLT